MQKVIIRGETNDDVVFTGYTVTPTAGTPVTVPSFTIRYPHTNAPDFMLADASANKWISMAGPLRKDANLCKALNGQIVDGAKTFTGQISVTPEMLINNADDAMLLKLKAMIDARMATGKFNTEKTFTELKIEEDLQRNEMIKMQDAVR